MRSSGIQLRIGDFLFSIQKRWKLIVALTFVGLVFGLLLSGVTYVQSGLQSFEVNGAFAINTLTNDRHLGGSASPAYNDFMLPPEMVDAVTYVMQSDHVLNEVINRQNLLGMSPAVLRKNLTLTQYNATQIVEMRLNWYNAEEGVGIWNAMIEAANQTLPGTLQLGSVAVINEPEAVMVGAGGSEGKLWVALTVLGFMAGLGFAVMELLMRPTLTNVKDVETVFGMETIGVIPRDNGYFRRKTSFLVQDEAGTNEIIQNYSAAAFILRNLLGTMEKHHCFYVTSATSQEGKSTVAANIAIQLSDMEHRTLLIDFDMRNSRLGSMFLERVDYSRSLNALYRGEATIQDAVTTLTGYLDILPSLIDNSAITMDSTIVELFNQFKEEYEYIVIDAPPVGEVSDTLKLNQVADTALFVAGYDMATIPEIQSSLDKLDKTGVRIVGCVVNAAQTGKSRGIAKDEKNTYREKKKKKEKTEEETFIPEEEDKKTGVEELVSSSPAKDGKKKPKRKKEKPKPKPKPPAPEPETAAPRAPARNTLEDLMDELPAEQKKNDQQVMDELLRIGIEGSWGPDEEAGRPQAAETTGEIAPAEEALTPESPAQSENSGTGEAPVPQNAAPPEKPETVQPEKKKNALPVIVKKRKKEWYSEKQIASEKASLVIAPEQDRTVSGPAAPEAGGNGPRTPGGPAALKEAAESPTPASAAESSKPNAQPAEENPAAKAPQPLPAGVEKKKKRRARAILPFYILLAIPLTAAGIAVLCAAAAVLAAAAAAALAFSVNGFASAFTVYTALADRLAASGFSLIALALGVFVFWLFVRVLLGMIPALVRRVIALGRRCCFVEETT